MKAVRLLSLGLAVVFAAALLARAEEKKAEKSVTLKGTLTCGKCTLKETDACSNALIVKKGDKEVTYYLADKGKGEKYHKCTGRLPNVEVTGVVSKKDGKMYIKPDKDGVKVPKKD